MSLALTALRPPPKLQTNSERHLIKFLPSMEGLSAFCRTGLTWGESTKMAGSVTTSDAKALFCSCSLSESCRVRLPLLAQDVPTLPEPVQNNPYAQQRAHVWKTYRALKQLDLRGAMDMPSDLRGSALLSSNLTTAIATETPGKTVSCGDASNASAKLAVSAKQSKKLVRMAPQADGANPLHEVIITHT